MSDLILPYHLRRDTLAYLKTQPLFVAKSMREVEVAQITKVMAAYLNAGCGHNQPEREAVTFYAGNAIWAELLKRYDLHEPLPAEALALAQRYVHGASLAAQRLMYYLVLIISRESRHVYSTAYDKMKELWGKSYTDFNINMHGYNSMAAKDYFLNHPPAMKLGDYVDAICWTFHTGKFGHGFGGHKWGEIADVFQKLVNGEFSPEMVTDVSWALCHNGGPIFNKEMVYSCYDNYELKLILDVQRSGQIPEMVRDIGSLSSSMYGNAPLAVRTMVADAVKLMPDAFGEYVDWYKVEAAGAVQSYPAYQQKQLAKHGASPLLSKVGQVEVPDNVEKFWVTPTVWVPVLKRAA